MTDSGLYAELTAIDDSIARYNNAKLNNKIKLSDIAVQIWDQVKLQNIATDLDLSESDFKKNIDGSIERVHRWLSEIKSTKIKNGLHIFGMPPKGDASPICSACWQITATYRQ